MLGFYEGQPDALYLDRVIRLWPRWLTRDNLRRHDAERFESLWAFVEQRRPERVCLRRTYALGDVLMLRPVVVAWRRHVGIETPILISTRPRIFRTLRGSADEHWEFTRDRGVGFDHGADVHFDLDRALQADHRGGPESDLHRVDLYTRAMGLPSAIFGRR